MIHQLRKGLTQQTPPVPGNYQSGDHRRVIIGRLIAFAPDQSDPDANGCRRRGDGVAAMMPGIRVHDRAAGDVGLAEDEPEQQFLDDDDGKENSEGERLGREVRLAHLLDGGDGNPGGGPQQHGRDHGRRNGFSFAVSIGVIFIGWFRRHQNRAPNHDGAENVERDSTASATKAWECPTIPANILLPARIVLISNPVKVTCRER